jgi:hydrogenase nickel incorporation protein HypA/HybF
MHEVAVARQIVEAVVDTALRHGGGRVCAARLVLGELTCIDPETLTFAFEVGCRGTCAESCRLEIRRLPLVLRCRGCGGEGERSGPVDPCPRCGAVGGDVLQGREIRLTTIDVDDEGASVAREGVG